ncbi:MAG: zinc ribbon domain-containing protein [Candidatus Acidiferrales bacterium]
MFCDRCGTALNPQAQFCSVCGRPISVSTTAASAGKLEKHVGILGVLWIVLGALRIMSAAWLYFIGLHWLPGIISAITDNIPAFPQGLPLARFVESIAVFGGMLGMIIGVLSIVAGYGLLQRAPWARIFVTVLAFLALLRPLLGTALGVYTLVVLLPQPSRLEYDRLAHAA